MALNNKIKQNRARSRNNLVNLFPVQNQPKQPEVAAEEISSDLAPTLPKKKPPAAKPAKPQKRLINSRKSDFKPQKRRKPRPTLPLYLRLCLYAVRLLIVGVGIGAIAGTILATIDPATIAIATKAEVETAQIIAPQTELESFKSFSGLNLSRELTSVKDKISAIATKYPQMQPRAFFLDLDDNAYIDLEADTPTSAASTIKIPVLIAFLQDVDGGKIRLDEMLTMTKETIGGGSGAMQYSKVGSKFSALETATKTIVISDNTGTNMLIDRLGGAEALNQRFLSWGMTGTAINNPLPDLKGTNITTARDLAYVLALVERGDLLSLRSRDRLFGIMRRTRTKTLLPKGLGKGAIIAHKTGDIGSILADAGVIDLPNGKRYLAAVMVKRPHNNYSARTMIQEISRAAYQYFRSDRH